jgi:uncharacterized protein (DUF1697 family)
MLGLHELQAALAGNPFAEAAPEKVQVYFMAQELPPATGDFIRSVARPGEAHAYRGKILWLHLPDGVARSKLAQRVSALPVEMTARNIRSVAAIAALAQRLEGE